MTTIPFDFSGNLLYLEANIGASRPMMFLLETGAGMSLVDEESAKELELATVETVQVAGAGGQATSVNVVEIPHLTIGGLSADGARVAAASLRHLWGSTGRRIDGLLGFDVLSHYVVELDYLRQMATFHKPAGFTYNGTGERLPFTLEFGALIHIEATIVQNGAAPVTDKFAVDTGAGGLAALILTGPFAAEHNLRGTLVHPVGGLGLGGASSADIGRVDELRIGSVSIEQPLTMFSRDTAGFLSMPGRGGVMGNEVLRRFKTIIDYSRQQLILEPNASLTDPFEYDMSGLIVRAEG
ncbi:MAG: clan AA aspartic protease, partial [bacterium]|nr:clan AA aspartic protease [bacterium]